MTPTPGNSDHHSNTNEMNKMRPTPKEHSTQNAEKEKFHLGNSSFIERDPDAGPDIVGY